MLQRMPRCPIEALSATDEREVFTRRCLDENSSEGLVRVVGRHTARERIAVNTVVYRYHVRTSDSNP